MFFKKKINWNSVFHRRARGIDKANQAMSLKDENNSLDKPSSVEDGKGHDLF